MEAYHTITNWKILGYVNGCLGIAINVFLFHALSKAQHRTMIQDLDFILTGLGILAFVEWLIAVFKNITKLMLVCIIFFGVELAVASCYLYNIVAYLGFSDDGAHLVLATVVCIAVFLVALFYLSIVVYLKVKENNRRNQIPQLHVARPLVAHA